MDQIFSSITFNTIDYDHIIYFIVLIILLLGSALISGSEVAFFSLTPNDRKQLSSSKKSSLAKVTQLLANPEELLATILITNNFINIAIVLLSSQLTSKLIVFNSATTEFIVQTILITFFILLFGEVIPKVYATRSAKQFATMMSLPILIFSKITKPFASFLISSTSIISKKLNKQNSSNSVSVNELSKALELTDQEEISQDKEILEGIVEFGKKSADDIMQPRMDITFISIDTPFNQVLDIVTDSGFSRIPVIKGSTDHIQGILYIKDLLPHIQKGVSFRWQTLIRSPYFIPESKKIDALLEDFRVNKVHMAIVVDEYGGTSGLVTLEDILEEIVGEISDELDDNEEQFIKLKENEYLFDGKTTILDFCKSIEEKTDLFDDIQGEADSLAGMILELSGEFPKVGYSFTAHKYKFIVESLERYRIETVKVIKLT